MTRLIPLGLIVALAAACSPAAPPTATPATPAASESTLAPSTPAPKSEAEQRADAMIEDLRRRQAAQAKFDRENPEPPPPRVEDLIRPSSAPPPVASPLAPAATTQAPAPTAVAPAAPASAPARDEQWWKNEMRTAQVRASNSIARVQTAAEQVQMAQRLIDASTKAPPAVFAEAQQGFYRATAEWRRVKAEADNDLAAIDRLREDARRANVPPGWLRWP